MVVVSFVYGQTVLCIWCFYIF